MIHQGINTGAMIATRKLSIAITGAAIRKYVPYAMDNYSVAIAKMLN
jgi:hypothetical protein